MRWSPQQKIRIGFWLLSLVPILLGYLMFRNATSLAESAGDVARTNEVEKRLERLLSQLKDVESAHRGYLLTGDERYAREINQLHQVIDRDVDDVSKMTVDQYWVELLKTTLSQKFDEVSNTLELRRTEGVRGVAEFLAKDLGDQPMDSIRTIFRNLITNEKEQLAKRTSHQRASFISTMTLFGLVLLLNVVFIVFIAFLVKRESEQFRALNEELARRVAIRTEALERSNEDLQQFAYSASHDLKEPLRMISSYATLLQRKYTGRLDNDADTYIGFIVDGAKRMDMLIGDLLEYSRAGQVRAKVIRPESAIESALENLKAVIAESEATVQVHPCPEVQYDPMRLCQVFQNLVGNAIKYRSERKPVIHISAVQNERETIFSVADNGIGIDEKYVTQVFGIFQRLHGKEYEGTGIGLAMVKKIVERHGGRIWVESKVNAGSTFHFTVPSGQGAEISHKKATA